MFKELPNKITEPIFIAKAIRNYPYHFFDDENNLYQLAHCLRFRTLPEKKLSKVNIGRCRGFKIDSRFVSLSNLQGKTYPKTMVILPINYDKENYCPF